jgi:CheY-like chemotaxis protein
MLWDWDRWRWLGGGASSYNIIFMDCIMPIMDGWQVGISGETQKHKETERQQLYSS